MESIGSMQRIPVLNRTNYDTWKLRIKAVLIKNRTWNYACGKIERPVLPDQPTKEDSKKLETWMEEDEKAKADLYLAVNDSELKQIKDCNTAYEIWKKLENMFESKGPARKASYWKKLIDHKLDTSGDVNQHLDNFFDIVNKLSELSIVVCPELQSIMLLHSLPQNFDNFRCAIESRDELPSPEILKIKILDECATRRQSQQQETQEALLTKKTWKPRKQEVQKKYENRTNEGDTNKFKFRCHRCRKLGHKAAECRTRIISEKTNVTEETERECDIQYALTIGEENRIGKWCLDSGCTSHICNNKDRFTKMEHAGEIKLRLANDKSIEVLGKGTVKLLTKIGRNNVKIDLKNTLYVPELRMNLISITKIVQSGFKVIFSSNQAVIEDVNGKKILIAYRKDNLYFVNEFEEELNATYTCNAAIENSRLETWHRRFGHLNYEHLLKMKRTGSVKKMEMENMKHGTNTCEICLESKMTCQSFPKMRPRRTEEILEIVHSDVCGPMRTQSLGGHRYFVTFTDDYSRWTEIHFIRTKDEVMTKFKLFKTFVEKQMQKKLKCIQSDKGGEYTSKEFTTFLNNEGIKRRFSISYTPQQNGLAERKNRTLIETARCMLIESRLPKSFWAEAISTANYLKNRCITRILDGKTPYELWYGKPPNVQHLRIFGEEAYILDKIPGKGKFDSRGTKGIFLGYDDYSKGYRIWVEKMQRVIISRDVKFTNKICRRSEESSNEDHLSKEDYVEVEIDNKIQESAERNVSENTSEENDRDDYEESVAEEENTHNQNEDQGETSEENLSDDLEDHQERRGPGRPKMLYTGNPGRPKKIYQRANVELTLKNINEESNFMMSDSCDDFVFLSEVNFKEALRGEEREEWKEAIMDEIESLIENDTWKLVTRPNDKNVIGCRTILRNKYKADGTVERRKARVVAQGFTQVPGIDFRDTYAPVARLSSVRLLLALSVKHSLKLNQFDIKTAYLNGSIDEEIFMEKPALLTECLNDIVRKHKGDLLGVKAGQMLEQLKHKDKVCRLQKSLYGLKQAGHQWYKCLEKSLINMGLKPSQADPCVYFMKRGGDMTIVLVYVDDIIVAYQKEKDLDLIKRKLADEFKVKDLGKIHYCLGIEICHNENRVSLSQAKYIRDILKRFKMEDCKPISTPMEVNLNLEKNTELSSKDIPYQELMGALNYLAVATRPDIAFAVSFLSQFNTCYGEEHWKAAKRVLRYLKGTMNYGINYVRTSNDHNKIKGFADANWGTCQIDRRSYTGLAFNFNDGCVTWESKKQKTVALSSTEAEYMAISEAGREAIYLKKFLTEVGFQIDYSIPIMNDNKGCQLLAKNQTFHARSKHIDIRHHYIRELLKNKEVMLDYLRTEEMPADILTKALPKIQHMKCMALLNIDNV